MQSDFSGLSEGYENSFEEYVPPLWTLIEGPISMYSLLIASLEGLLLVILMAHFFSSD